MGRGKDQRKVAGTCANGTPSNAPWVQVQMYGPKQSHAWVQMCIQLTCSEEKASKEESPMENHDTRGVMHSHAGSPRCGGEEVGDR